VVEGWRDGTKKQRISAPARSHRELELIAEARRLPSQTPSRHSTSERTELAPALNHSPSSARFRVCKLKEENVVYPPQIPSMKNCRNVAGASHRPSGPVAVANSPMTNEPETLMQSVPQGKVSPILLAMKPEAPHLAKLPRPPPTNIHSALHISPTPPRHMTVVGVISTETDQAIFPFGKANPIAAAIVAQLQSDWQPVFPGHVSLTGLHQARNHRAGSPMHGFSVSPILAIKRLPWMTAFQVEPRGACPLFGHTAGASVVSAGLIVGAWELMGDTWTTGRTQDAHRR